MVAIDAVEGEDFPGGEVGGLFDADGVFAGFNTDTFPKLNFIIPYNAFLSAPCIYTYIGIIWAKTYLE